MNTKLHAVTDANGRPLSFFITARQVSDYTGAAALLDDLRKAKWMAAMTLTGSEMRWSRRASNRAFQAANSARCLSDTTSGGTNGATASRSCSAV